MDCTKGREETVVARIIRACGSRDRSTASAGIAFRKSPSRPMRNTSTVPSTWPVRNSG